MGAKVYFIKGGDYARYALDPDPGTVEYVKSIATNWGSVADRGFASGLDAAINDDAGEDVSFYKGGNHVRYGVARNDIVDLVGEPPYPWPNTNGWASFLRAPASRTTSTAASAWGTAARAGSSTTTAVCAGPLRVGFFRDRT
ncbi:hypothetical protein ACH4PU_17745 [Streptomyces sp. NPDC021100]|uniref:hypothetical protein n=1 Tax=Streptomyces sp. NPDC021100 TaxID=3365114 RepID=UPI0037A21FC0